MPPPPGRVFMRFLCGAPGSHIDPLHALWLGLRGGSLMSASDDPHLGRAMIDILLLALGAGFFGLLAAYAAGCERV